MTRPSVRRQMTLLAFLVPCAIYLFSLPAIFTGDDLQQAMQVEQCVTGVPYYHPAGGRLYEPGLTRRADERLKAVPLNPRYLLELPTVVAATRAWKRAGWDGNVILPIATFHAVAGALGCLFLFLSLMHLRGDATAALAGSLGLATAAGYWSYSTAVDQSITMVMFLCLAFYVLVRQREGVSRGGLLILAVVLTAAALYNVTALLSVPAFGAAVALIGPRSSVWHRGRRFLILSALSGTMTVLTVLLVIAVFRPPRVLDGAYWSDILFAGRPEYAVDPARDIVRAAVGLAKSQVTPPWVAGSLQEHWDSAGHAARAGLMGFFGAVLAVMSAPAVALVAGRNRPSADERWLGVMLPLWFAVHAAFGLFWDPGFIKYWLVPLIPVWVVFALFLDRAGQRPGRRYRLALAGVALFVGFTLVTNLLARALPGSRGADNPWPTIAGALRDSKEGDLFVSDGHPLEFYIAYFAHRDVVSTALINYANAGEPAVLGRVLGEQLRRHRSDGGDVYLFSARTGGIDALARAVGLTDAAPLVPRWEFRQVTIYRAPAP